MEENPNLAPIHIPDSRDVTEISVHRDVDLVESEFEALNSALTTAGVSPIGNRRTKLGWATPSQSGVYWEFEIELYTLPGREGTSLQLHMMLVGNKISHTTPTAYKRSRRALNRIRPLANVLFSEKISGAFDCAVTMHSTSDSWLLPMVLPVQPDFPEESAIQEVSGVIGGSVDGMTKFVVDRVRTDPMMFHVWLGFKTDLSFSQNILAEAATEGTAILEKINLWGH